LSAANEDHTDTFGGLTPAQYHTWRAESELYHTVESATVLPILQLTNFRRALDIGCGTGIWTCRLKQHRPASECVGIDIAAEMISLAVRKCSARFEAVDAMSFRDQNRFDLVISALSADYIGFPDFFRVVAANLADDGTAYAWFLDPRRYPRAGSRRIKTWQVSGRQVCVEVPDYDPTMLVELASRSGLLCNTTQIPFELRDRIQRTFLMIRCTAG
jgi:SAM-dependent methyltransferase